MRSVRLRALVGVALLAILGVSVTGVAHHQSGTPNYTACLNTTTGTLIKVKQGNVPVGSGTCPSSNTMIHLSGGDITGVLTAVDGGLSGGATNGTASLSVDFNNLDGRYVNEEDAPALFWRGAWSSSAGYAPDDLVNYGGSSYTALTSSTNAKPDTNPSKWQLLAKKGANGAVGPAGPDGPAGPAGFNWQGEWIDSIQYYYGDMVSYEGSTYRATVDSIIGLAPPDDFPYWVVIAAKGADGAGSRSFNAPFNNDCTESDQVDVAIFMTISGTCLIEFPAGTVDGFGVPFVEWGTLVAQTLTSGGGGSIEVNPSENNYFFVSIESAGPFEPDGPSSMSGSGNDVRGTSEP